MTMKHFLLDFLASLDEGVREFKRAFRRMRQRRDRRQQPTVF